MRLVIFDVDGTISDSQTHILHAMTMAYASEGLPAPARELVLSIVGLSLPEAVARIAPELAVLQQDAIVAAYKASYRNTRAASPAPLYAGAEASIRRLAARDDLLLGVATGKSRRGLRALLDHHQLNGLFVTTQVADDHPSKPNPSMVLTALSEAGVNARDAVMIGDTTFDMDMAVSAGVAGIGVSWGYHPVAALRKSGAARIVDDFDALERMIDEILEIK
jgi:phosphoglycolate phosphatase